MARFGRAYPIAPIVHKTLYAEPAASVTDPVVSQLFGAVGIPIGCVILAWLLVLLWVTSVAALTVTIAWDAPTLDAAGNPLTDLASYKIYRCTGSACTPTLFTSPAGLSTTYADSTISLGTIYRYRVTAVDVNNNESAVSNTIEIGPPPPPGQPTLH